MMQSPGFQFSIGIRFKKFLSASGSIPTKDGIPAVFSAKRSPFASINTVAKSFDSRTMVENDVRNKAAADSSAMEINRLPKESQVSPGRNLPSYYLSFFLFGCCRRRHGRLTPIL